MLWLHKLAALCSLSTIALTILAAPRPASAQQHSLLSRARQDGTVRVIVQIGNTGYKSIGTLPSARAVGSQRQAIAKAQDMLLARLEPSGPTLVRRFRNIPYLAMEVDAAALSDLLQNPEVISVQEDLPVPPSLAVSTSIIGAPDAWDAGYSGSGQAVAVLDTGIQKTHPFLSGKVVSEACYSTNSSANSSSSLCPGGVENSTATGSALNCDVSIPGCDHGTHVAGIVAGKGTSFSGVAKDADLISIQVFSRIDDPVFCGVPSCVGSWTSDQIQALERVLELSATIDIASVNLSLGGRAYTTTESCDLNNAAMKTAIDNLRSVDVATVIASGNYSRINAISAPGCISTAISAGSTNDTEAISGFSNEANFLSLYAPGAGIWSSVPFNHFSSKSGTSMATPHVAGAWAILKQRAPATSVDTALLALQTTGVPITSTLGTWTTSRIRARARITSHFGTSMHPA